jgi:hypothetical protein
MLELHERAASQLLFHVHMSYFTSSLLELHLSNLISCQSIIGVNLLLAGIVWLWWHSWLNLASYVMLSHLFSLDKDASYPDLQYNL